MDNLSLEGGEDMDLELESGRIIRGATEDDIRTHVEGEDYAILSADSNTYIQCAERRDAPNKYEIEYQDGSLHEHYRAADGPVTMDQIISSFVKYLNGDSSWRSDFQWERMDL
jgi:hypothetical protein